MEEIKPGDIIPTVGLLMDSLPQYLERHEKYVEKRKERELLEKAGYDHLHM